MRVLAAIVIPPHMTISGAARAAERLSAELANKCDITVASMMNGRGMIPAAGPSASKREAVSVFLPPLLRSSIVPNRFKTLFYRSSLPEIVARGNYDLVHLHNPLPALELARTARACLQKRVPYVVSTHGFNEVANGAEVYGFDPVRRQMWRSMVEQPVAKVVRKAAEVLALSPADFDIVRAMGFEGPGLSVVTNGVDAPPQQDDAVDLNLLSRLGITERRAGDPITCMFLANHTPNKGLPVLLEAFASMEQPYLLIVGGEKRPNVAYERYIAGCRPGQRIVVTGRLADEEVAALYRRSDLFVYPTLADTFPLVVLEAMSYGLAIVATRVGGIPHQVEGGCGELVAPGDPSEIAAAVSRLTTERQRLFTMGKKAQSRVLAEYSWSRSAENAILAYKRALDRKT
jgi:alpha-maltose-1-phosphate synthase